MAQKKRPVKSNKETVPLEPVFIKRSLSKSIVPYSGTMEFGYLET
ncbi:hypothetical protein D1AOALGA4SA_12069 [Olavius algarvensis Delta 1 endosymbiont]|nr:hypothetical protein D1AOALGA4SA_12069 [Olavius algarvensis Delta 1 endosymbiont]